MSSAQVPVEVLTSSDDDGDDGEVQFVAETRQSGTAHHPMTRQHPEIEPILIDSDPDDDLIIQREVRVGNQPEDDLQITGEQQGFVMSLPSGPMFVPMSHGHNLRRGGMRRRVAAINVPRTRAARTRAAAQTQHFNMSPELLRHLQLQTERQGHYETQQIQQRQERQWQLLDRIQRSTQGMPHILGLRGDFRASIRNLIGHMTGLYGPADDGDNVPQHLMDELARQDQVEEDNRVRRRRKVADKMKKDKETKAEIPENLKDKFTQSILPENDNLCVLCGVVLAEGIPKNHKVLTDEKEIKRLVLDEGFRCPWQCCRRLTDADFGLSKKVFFGKCGHVYCGRCVNNIMRSKNAGKKAGVTKRRRRRNINFDKVSVADVDFDDPDVSGPNKCVAPGCNRAMMGKFYFRELYM